jgi:hypothetical protein
MLKGVLIKGVLMGVELRGRIEGGMMKGVGLVMGVKRLRYRSNRGDYRWITVLPSGKTLICIGLNK